MAPRNLLMVESNITSPRPLFPPPSADSGPQNLSNDHQKLLLGFAIAGGITFLSALFFVVLILYKRIKGSKTNPYDPPAIKLQRFSYTELKIATEGFIDSKKLGQGGFGAVYRGILRDGREVAVKKLDSTSLQGEREFQNEVTVIGKVSSPHIVGLLGFCSEHGRRLLVYEYMEHGSLQEALFDGEYPVPLDWNARFGIIMDTAKALAFLHLGCQPPVIHGDIKPSNVLLDAKFCARIADFGMARLKTEGSPANQICGAEDVKKNEIRQEPKQELKKKCEEKKKLDAVDLQRKNGELLAPVEDLAMVMARDREKDQSIHNAGCKEKKEDHMNNAGCRENIFETNGAEIYGKEHGMRIEEEDSEDMEENEEDMQDGECSSDSYWDGSPAKPSKELGKLANGSKRQVKKETKRKKKRRKIWWWNHNKKGSELESGTSYGLDPWGFHHDLGCKGVALKQNEKGVDRNLSLDWWGGCLGECSCKNNKDSCKGLAPRPKEWWREEYVDELSTKKWKKSPCKSPKRHSYCIDLSGELNQSKKSSARDWWSGDLMHWRSRRGESGSIDFSGDLNLHSKELKPQKNREWWSGDLMSRSKEWWSGDLLAKGREWWSGDLSNQNQNLSLKTGLSSTPSMRGTICYVAPEYGGGGILSEKCDVYSFGVLMLVIVAGRRPLQVAASPGLQFEKANLTAYARHLAQSGNVLELVDRTLQGDFSRDQAHLCIMVALQCLQRLPAVRPNMAEVVKILSGETQMPSPSPSSFEFSPSPPCSIPNSFVAAHPIAETPLLA